MYLKIKKSFFSRNRDREKEVGDIFNKTSRGLTSIVPLIITIFFTPALITTSLFSKEIILMLANFSLSLGYLTNFAYRIYQKEVSKAELLITLIALSGFLTLAYFVCPPIATLTFISALYTLNQIAVVVNLFFLLKHVVVPPCKKLIENIAQYIGFDIAGRYYSKPPLTLEKDRYIIDQLLVKGYNHDSYSPEFSMKELDSFNALLTKLSYYIDKKDESILGYINNRDDIARLEDHIAQLTTQANPDSSYTFIRKKIGFKTTKIHMLQAAKETVSTALQDPKQDPNIVLTFFKGISSDELKTEREFVLGTGLHQLETEIKRQKSKISSLEACLPPPGNTCGL